MKNHVDRFDETAINRIRDLINDDTQSNVSNSMVNNNKAINILDEIQRQRIELLDLNKKPTKIMINHLDLAVLAASTFDQMVFDLSGLTSGKIVIAGLNAIPYKGKTTVYWTF